MTTLRIILIWLCLSILYLSVYAQQKRRCKHPGKFDNGSIRGSTRLGGTLTFRCRRRYHLLGDSSITCRRVRGRAVWSGEVPTCVPRSARCEDPSKPANGDLVTNFTTVANMCEEGYVLVGNQYRYCDFESGRWSGSDPTCEIDCAHAPMTECSDTAVRYYYNDVTLQCEEIMTCDVTGNSFETLSECNQVCPGPCVQDVPYNGSCDHTELMYYYHVFEDRCYPFSDGCPAVRGVDNSFTDLQDCLDTCKRSCDDPDTPGFTRIHRAAWVTTDCKACQCTNGRASCSPPNTQSFDCIPVTNCTGEIVMSNETLCCPVCVETACKRDGITYSDGAVFMEDLCTTCQCVEGEINCTTITCMECPDGSTPYDLTEECCPRCIPTLGSCELMQYPPDTLSLFNGACSSLVAVVSRKCPELCIKNDTVNCCVSLTETTAAEFECTNLPGFPITIKYQDVIDCDCSPCG